MGGEKRLDGLHDQLVNRRGSLAPRIGTDSVQ
jgi:hypothetical protein